MIPDITITCLDNIPHYEDACYIYAWYRADRCLYVGSTTKLKTRLDAHHIITKDVFISGDRIEVYILDLSDTNKTLQELECSVIRLIAPTYNKNIIPSDNLWCDFCGKPFLPTTQWQRFCSITCRNRWHNVKRRKNIAAT